MHICLGVSTAMLISRCDVVRMRLLTPAVSQSSFDLGLLNSRASNPWLSVIKLGNKLGRLAAWDEGLLPRVSKEACRSYIAGKPI